MIAARTGHMAVLKLLFETGANLSVLDNADNNILHIACMEGNLEIVNYLISRNIIDIDSRGDHGTTPLMLAARFGKMEMFNFLLKTGANISKEDDDGENILHKSCKGGNVDIVKDVITHRVLYVNSTDNNGITPLMLAAGYGNKVVFQLLIDRAADTSAKDDTDRTILHWACEGGNVKIVKDLLTQCTVDINSNDRKGMTPLLFAAYHGKSDVLGLLIKKGANALAVDHRKRNILHLSCTGGHVDAVWYVLNHTSVDINGKDHTETTPVLLAAYHGEIKVFDILVENGADLTAVDKYGDNILHCACHGGSVEITNRILMQNIVDINSKGDGGMTPVLMAASEGEKEVFDFLVTQGADLLVTDEDGQTILHRACHGGNIKIVNYVLIQNIVDINSKDDKGMTAVLVAAFLGNREVLDFLVRQGVDMLVADNDGQNILHLACQKGNVEMVKYILTKKRLGINTKGFWGMPPVLQSAYYGKKEVFDVLVKQGADLSVVDEYGDNILHCACHGGSVEIANHILMQNIVDINSKGDEGMTPVLVAASEGEREVFDFLVTQGADLLVTDEDGQTILHHACHGGNMEIVNYIRIQNIVDINSKDDEGMTAVLVAASLGNREVLDFLVRQGADMLVADNDGQNILHLACKEGNVEIVKYILTKKLLGINTKGIRGMPPVLQSAYYGKREVFDVLVKQGADLSVVDKNGDSILHLACRRGNVEMVNDILTQKFVDINTKGYMGMPPVLLAVCFFNREVFEFLVKKGADLSVVDKHGDNILHLVCRYGNMKIVNYILTHTTLNINSTNNKKMTPLLMAAYHGKKDVLGLLLETGADTSAVDHKNNNVLHLSCTGGHVDTVKFILNLNIVDINSKDLSGMTPVMLAAYWGKREIFYILVQQGADLSITDQIGDNILHKACIGGNKDTVKHVLKLHIVDINSRGSKGMTALLYAAEYSDGDMFDLLLRNGADLSVVNDDGNNALHLACEEGANDIVESVLSQSTVNITAKNNKGLNAAEIAREEGYLSTAKLLS
ncbi:serine/threonine-protein phosphatase 6 regulatory ankyrin repeat subunit A-like [Haliotis asinina]|uniref:serine/threonine-protein phosphatase 6 regulatory ankyrin repeat subunit A-like n=1 Tax=Haliotis asinina TaxID=109174 RepID=UPI0035320152